MKYRAVCKRKGMYSWIEIQSKKRWYKPWENVAKCSTIEEADILIKRCSEGIVVTAIHDYDKSGERIADYCW
jgi:hypothetical protein